MNITTYPQTTTHAVYKSYAMALIVDQIHYNVADICHIFQPEIWQYEPNQITNLSLEVLCSIAENIISIGFGSNMNIESKMLTEIYATKDELSVYHNPNAPMQTHLGCSFLHPNSKLDLYLDQLYLSMADLYIRTGVFSYLIQEIVAEGIRINKNLFEVNVSIRNTSNIINANSKTAYLKVDVVWC